MAAVNTKSTEVTNADAVPFVATALHVAGARLYEKVGTVEVAVADDNASVYRFCRVHSSWRISSIELFNDAIQSGTTYDCGLYQTAENGGAAVDADCYATDVTMVSARVVPTDIKYEVMDIANIEKRVFEDAALTTDPGRWYDLCLTGDAVGSGAGTISLRVRYVGPA